MRFPLFNRRARVVNQSVKAAKRATRFRPAIEALEGRELPATTIFVVPTSQPVDVKHRHSLKDALPFAGPTGTVIIEPGATADSASVDITLIGGINIKGDDNVPGSILPRYDLNIKTSQVNLFNLNLGNLVVDPTASNTTVTKSQIVNFTETGATSGAGHNTLSQNVITGEVDLQGNSGLLQGTGDQVDHNTFQSATPIMLELTNSNSTQIRENSFYGDGPNQVGIIVRSNSDKVVVANNHIALTGTGSTVAIELINTGGAAGNILGASVLDNELSTGGTGTGIYCNIFGTGATFVAQLEGNDLHGNLKGVDINGITNSATGAGNIDLGGGSSALGSSKGGNNFRSFDGANGHYAIRLRNTDANVSVSAKFNTFDVGINPAAVVQTGSNGGTGTIDVSSALNADRAFVQNLYVHQLGRAGDPAAGTELDGWVAQLPTIGRNGVVHSILYSPESLNRIIDRFYLTYLGRASGADERAGWVSMVQNGQSIDQIEASFISSPEFLGHINTDFVQALYINILGRTGSATELAGWYNVLPQLGLQGVAAQFTGSQEHRKNTVSDYFERFLHRTPTDAEATGLANVSGDLLSIEGLVLGSDEFYNKG
jgi:hypothetical protein